MRVLPLAVPPVMPPRAGDIVTLLGGVIIASSFERVWEMVNWLVAVVAPMMIDGSEQR